jgi:hypothetical protein
MTLLASLLHLILRAAASPMMGPVKAIKLDPNQNLTKKIYRKKRAHTGATSQLRPSTNRR